MAKNYLYDYNGNFEFDEENEDLQNMKEYFRTLYNDESTYTADAEEEDDDVYHGLAFQDLRNLLKERGQKARSEFNENAVATYLQNAAANPDDSTYRETLRRFSMMAPRNVLALINVADGGEFEGEETGEEY